MRLRVYSDLHLESAAFCPPLGDCDAVVLAGDIDEGTAGVTWARETFAGLPVIYVAGNHEYYGQDFATLPDRLREAARDSSVHVLERAACAIAGVRFLGCTLWSDFELLADARLSMEEAQRRGLDYQAIMAGPRKFRPADARRAHLDAVRWLTAELEEPHPGPTVVVTHHAPSALSVPDAYLTRPRAAAYASHLDQLVEESGAHLWVHGHVHRCCDYTLGDTRVRCNPRGVRDESADEFDPSCTADILT